MNILRNTDKTARHLSLEFILHSHISCVRAAIGHGDTETLGSAYSDISSHLSWSLGNGKRKDICNNSNDDLVLLQLGNSGCVVMNVTEVVGVLHKISAEFRSLGPVEVGRLVNDKLNTKTIGLSLNDLDVLCKDVLGEEEFCSLSIVHVVCHEHCL